MQQMAPALGIVLILIMVLVGLLFFVLTIIIYCKIFSKAGYCWVLGFLMLVPIANLIMLLVLAFSDWPVLKELRMLKQQGTPG